MTERNRLLDHLGRPKWLPLPRYDSDHLLKEWDPEDYWKAFTLTLVRPTGAGTQPPPDETSPVAPYNGDGDAQRVRPPWLPVEVEASPYWDEENDTPYAEAAEGYDGRTLTLYLVVDRWEREPPRIGPRAAVLAQWVLAESTDDADGQIDWPSVEFASVRTVYGYGITEPGGLPLPSVRDLAYRNRRFFGETVPL